MHNPAPVLENDTHKILWNFNIHTDRLIQARRPDLIIINKLKKREFAKLSTRGLGNKRTSKDHSNDSIAENGQNLETIPRDLKTPVVAETSVKNYQLTLM